MFSNWILQAKLWNIRLNKSEHIPDASRRTRHPLDDNCKEADLSHFKLWSTHLTKDEHFHNVFINGKFIPVEIITT